MNMFVFAGPGLRSQVGELLMQHIIRELQRYLVEDRQRADSRHTLDGRHLLSDRGLQAAGLEVEPILKVHEGRPNIEDAIRSARILLIINTPIGRQAALGLAHAHAAACGLG